MHVSVESESVWVGIGSRLRKALSAQVSDIPALVEEPSDEVRKIGRLRKSTIFVQAAVLKSGLSSATQSYPSLQSLTSGRMLLRGLPMNGFAFE